jgi:hypothetical protein
MHIDTETQIMSDDAKVKDEFIVLQAHNNVKEVDREDILAC